MSCDVCCRRVLAYIPTSFFLLPCISEKVELVLLDCTELDSNPADRGSDSVMEPTCSDFTFSFFMLPSLSRLVVVFVTFVL